LKVDHVGLAQGDWNY